MASKTPSQPKRKIADVTKPDVAADIKTPQIVIEKRSRIQPTEAPDTPATDEVAEKPVTRTSAMLVTPPSEAADGAKPEEAALASSTTATKETPADTPHTGASEPVENDTAPTPATADKAAEATKPDTAPAKATVTNDFASRSDGNNPEAPAQKSEAAQEAEAKKQAEAEERRQKQIDQYIDTREFFVPINAAARKRSIEVSLWLTLVYIILSVVLIDLMLDSGMIELLQKVPHTNFFAT